MFEVISLSKSKPRSIILLHGLFTGPGFWLPYLKYFSNYNVILVDINYSLVTSIGEFLPDFKLKIESISQSKDIVAIISHSLGTCLSSLLGENFSKFNINICPIYLAERQNTEQFVEFISTNDASYSFDEVLKILGEVDDFLHQKAFRVEAVTFRSTHLLVPDQDPFFSYKTESRDSLTYAGDHFDINDALLKIKVNGYI